MRKSVIYTASSKPCPEQGRWHLTYPVGVLSVEINHKLGELSVLAKCRQSSCQQAVYRTLEGTIWGHHKYSISHITFCHVSSQQWPAPWKAKWVPGGLNTGFRTLELVLATWKTCECIPSSHDWWLICACPTDCRNFIKNKEPFSINDNTTVIIYYIAHAEL